MNDDFSKLMNAILGGGGAHPAIDRTDVGEFTVSTVDSMDMGPETAIIDSEGAHPVERYETIEEATTGHQAWVARLKKGERKITRLGYGSMTEGEEHELK